MEPFDGAQDKLREQSWRRISIPNRRDPSLACDDSVASPTHIVPVFVWEGDMPRDFAQALFELQVWLKEMNL